MREIFNKKKKYSKITQGTIITGCVSQRYIGCDVYGCIITARCDLANEKVDSVHYLPIISYEDWLKREIFEDFKNEWISNRKKKVIQKLKEHNFPEDFIDRNLTREGLLASISANFKNKKDTDAFIKVYDEWQSAISCNNNKILKEKDTEGVLKRYIEMLVKNERSEWYFIEDWNNNDEDEKYRIILLKEINKISISCALKLPDGILEEDVNDSFYSDNMLARTDDKELMYYVESEIKSPFIEHILQRFSLNFYRIGVEDINTAQVTEKLLEQSKKIIS